MTGPGMSADTWEFLAVLLAVISSAIVIAGNIIWRRDRWPLILCLGAVIPVIIARTAWSWDEAEILGLLFLEAWAGGMIAYAALRILLRFSPPAAWIGSIANGILLPALLHVLGIAPRHEHSLKVLGVLPIILLGTIVIIVLIGWVIREIVRAAKSAPVPRSDEGAEPATSEEERRLILQMTADGKISSQEAAELSRALGANNRPGDRLPMTSAVRASIVGGLAVVIGFMLPWGSVRILGVIQGHQAGYHVGFLGWLILSLGLMPAILACIPALDKHLRQGLLRLIFSATGIAFVLSLAFSIVTGKRFPGIGLWLGSLGFGIQIVSALAQSGLWPRRTPPARA